MPHECTTCGRTFEDGSKQMLSGCPDCGGNKFQFQPAGRDSGEPAEAASTAGAENSPPVDSQSDGVPEADVEREMAELAKDTEPEVGTTETDEPDTDEQPNPAASAVDASADEFRDAEIADDVGEENRAQSDARSSSASFDEIDEARRKMAEAEEERLSAVDDTSARGATQGPPRDPPSGGASDEFDISGAVGPDDGDPVEKQPVAGSAPESEDPTTSDDGDLAELRSELNDQFESIKITAPGQYELNLMELYDRKEYIISLQEDGRYVIEMADDYGIDDG